MNAPSESILKNYIRPSSPALANSTSSQNPSMSQAPPSSRPRTKTRKIYYFYWIIPVLYSGKREG